ncbi:MerR family transcriptional regulator, partial [Agreia sp.]
MKVSQLSAETGVPLPTIKMYLRKGLLQPGDKTEPNQAEYGE